MHLLFFAHKMEAMAFINKGQTKRFKWEGMNWYQTDNYLVCLTHTPPKLPTNLPIEQLPRAISHIFNIGICAATNHTFQLGQITEPDVITNQDSHSPNAITLLTLGTVYQADMSIQADLVDMEAFTIQQFATAQQRPFTCIKIISDFGDQTTAQIQKKMPTLSEDLYQYYLSKRF